MSAITPRFFGYGSLVNLATHDYPNAQIADVSGWARSWLALKGRDYATLSAVPDETTKLKGIIADVPNADWAALDAREMFYDRHTLADGCAIYAVPEHAYAAPDVTLPILLSYLDVVIQGYHRHFGDAGVSHFIETTRGWHMPVLNDRAAPIYPRAQQLTPREVGITDDVLKQMGSQFAQA